MSDRKKMIRMTDEEYAALKGVVLERQSAVEDWVMLAQDRSGLVRAEAAQVRVNTALEVLNRVEALL